MEHLDNRFPNANMLITILVEYILQGGNPIALVGADPASLIELRDCLRNIGYTVAADYVHKHIKSPLV